MATEELSCCEQFFSRAMEPDDLLPILFHKVAPYRVVDHLLQVFARKFCLDRARVV